MSATHNNIIPACSPVNIRAVSGFGYFDEVSPVTGDRPGGPTGTLPMGQ